MRSADAKRILLFFRSDFKIVGVGVNDNRIEDFDLNKWMQNYPLLQTDEGSRS
jgi:hypothetical protein